MIGIFGIPLIIALSAFLGLQVISGARQSKKLLNAQDLLRLAKQETMETAQISLNNPYPLIQISKEGKIIFINNAAYKDFPGIVEQDKKHPLLSGLEPLFGKKEPVAREVSIGKRVYHQTITPTQVSGQPAYILYCYDITRRKSYERQLKESRIIAEKARKEAEKANQARGEFLANMSHELRTPMNGIIGLSDILAEAGLKPEHQEMIDAINSSARNLLALLNEILDFSKIEAGELALENIPYDPRKIVKQIESLQRPIAAAKGLEMKSEVAKSVPLRLIGDPTRLQQILNNLIGNAVKFTEKGSITVSIGGKEDGQDNFILALSVTDTGIGIPKEKQQKIFEKFQQAETSTTRKYGGTGLGLAITKHLAELMGGNIALNSTEGKGTTFTVTIPVQIAAMNTAEESAVKDKDAGEIDLSAKVLVVDDHPVNLLFMRQALIKMGFMTLYEASSGEQAIALFKERHPNLVLMDCKMPEMDGYEASRQIRQIEGSNHRPVIIAVTADAMKSAEEKCSAAGMDDYISKPVEKEKLREVLQRWIPGSGAAREAKKESVQADPGSEQESSPVFDWNHLKEFTDGNEETEKMLISMFLENLDLDIKDLQKSFYENNFIKWEAKAHKLCGASSHMGAYALAEVCDKAQSLETEDPVKMQELHHLILSETQRLHGILEKRQA